MCGKNEFSCKPKCKSAVQVNQICMCTFLQTKNDACGSRLTSCVNMHAPEVHAHIIDL